MENISIVTIVNNNQVYKEFLENLKHQVNIDYQLLPIINDNNQYDSARSAYNSVINECIGDYVLFCHPDIRFLDDESLYHMFQYVKEIREFGVVGVAGAAKSQKNGRIIFSNILHGIDRRNAGEQIREAMEVQTVDECLFIFEKEYIKQKKFSNKKGWHLYAVEECLDALMAKKNNYVIPANLWHISDGKSLDSNYMIQLEEIIKTYKSNFKLICTTVKAWKTQGFYAWAYRKYYRFKQCIKRKVMK